MVEQRIDAGNDGHTTIAMPEALAGDVAGSQRGGTRGIHRYARPPHIEAVRNPVGGDAASRAGGGINIRHVVPVAVNLHRRVVSR